MRAFARPFPIQAAFAALLLAASTLAFPQASRTWVSGVGDDVNPCSRTAPCKTFAGAISKTAAGGEISVLDPGGYGALTITKSITINGDSMLASILVSGTNGITVNAAATDVVILRGISLNGIGSGLNGVNFLAGKALLVENVTVYGFTQQGILFQPSGSSSLFVSHSSFSNNTGGALLVAPSGSGTASATIDGVTMQQNGRGLRAEDGAAVVVRNSVAAGNAANGFVALGASRAVDMTLESSAASRNGAVGVYAGPFATVRISNVTATGNNVGLQSAGGTIVSFGNNRVQGNISADGTANVNSGQI